MPCPPFHTPCLGPCPPFSLPCSLPPCHRWPLPPSPWGHGTWDSCRMSHAACLMPHMVPYMVVTLPTVGDISFDSVVRSDHGCPLDAHLPVWLPPRPTLCPPLAASLSRAVMPLTHRSASSPAYETSSSVHIPSHTIVCTHWWMNY